MTAPSVSPLADGARFLSAGLANTLLTLVVYQLLLFVVSPGTAYALSWVLGLAFVVVVYPTRVFPAGRRSPADRIALGMLYVGVFVLGLGLLELLRRGGTPPRFGILLVMAATTAATFVGSRLLLRRV